MFRQQQNILVPLSQWWQTELHHVQAVKEVFPKFILADGLDDISVRHAAMSRTSTRNS